MDRKISQYINTYIRQNRFQNKCHKKRQKGHFIILNERIHQEAENMVNISTHNMGSHIYIKEILEDFKKEIDRNTLIEGDLE